MMRKMTNAVLALGLLLAVGFTSANAQDVTDEDIKNYAIIELAKNSITDGISPMVNDRTAVSRIAEQQWRSGSGMGNQVSGSGK